MIPGNFSEVLSCLHQMDSTDDKRILIGVFFAVMTTAAVTLDLLLIIIYYKLWYKIGNAVIYRMSLSLALSSIVEMSVNFYYMIPCTVTTCNFYYWSDPLLIVLAVPETVGFYTSAFTNSVIAVERLALFFSKPVNLFIGKYHKILIAIPWFFGFGVSAVAALIGCHKRFNRYNFQYTFNCNNCAVFGSIDYATLLFFFIQVVTGVMLCGYVAILVHIVFGKRHIFNTTDTRMLKHIPLVMQFFALCAFQWLSATMFYTFNSGILMSNPTAEAMVSNGFIIGNAAVNAIVSFGFNKTIRKGLINLMSGDWVEKTPTVLGCSKTTKVQQIQTRGN